MTVAGGRIARGAVIGDEVEVRCDTVTDDGTRMADVARPAAVETLVLSGCGCHIR